ncbi:ATP-binding protein [Chloroflexota bacterium]
MTEVNAQDVYVRICQKIPELEESKVLPRMLRFLLTPEQAQLAAEFPGVDEELATRVGRDLESVKKDLQYMYEIGIGVSSAKSGKWNLPPTHRMLSARIPSHHKRFLPFLDADYQDLWVELDAEYTKMREEKGLPPVIMGAIESRMVPAYWAVKDKPELQPWEDIRVMLQVAEKIAVIDCPCRERKKQACKMVAHQTCFVFNKSAEYAVDSKETEKLLTIDEALKVIRYAEKSGTVHMVGNNRTLERTALCNCCNDCCDGLPFYFKGIRHIAPSRYQPVIEAELCDGCKTCATCMFGAIKMTRNAEGNLKAVLNPDKCLGCLTCTLRCPNGAMKVECIKPEEWVPVEEPKAAVERGY